ncbi:ENHANCER OF AG-4 protein 2 [Platanthera guangdongensis]|uniref:ENHANCER OF AG-4 protein 2 n=1 Tax=Platanthera guangdongensis TaxID=2320717 RepID=A0ABR2MZ21_9ASPA
MPVLLSSLHSISLCRSVAWDEEEDQLQPSRDKVLSVTWVELKLSGSKSYVRLFRENRRGKKSQIWTQSTMHAFVAPVDIQIFTNESKSKLLTRCQGKTVKYFARAVEEICNAFEKLQKSANELGEGASKIEMRSISSFAVSDEGKRHLNSHDSHQLEVQDVILDKFENEKNFGSIDELLSEPCPQIHKITAVTELNDAAREPVSPVLSFKRGKSSIHPKKKPKEARATVPGPALDGDILEKASGHQDSSHHTVTEAFPENNVAETSVKLCSDDKTLHVPSSYLETTDSKEKEEANGQVTTSDILLQKSEVDNDLKVQKIHTGQVKTKKLPLSGCASNPEGKVKSTSEECPGDSKKLGTHVNTVKRSGKNAKKRSSENVLPDKGISEDKPTTEGKPVLEASRSYKKETVGSMKRKMVNNEDFPSAKRTKSSGKGVDIPKGSSKGDVSNFTSNNKSRRNVKNITLAAQKADTNLASKAEPHDYKNQSNIVKPCKGSEVVSKCLVSIADVAKAHEGSGDVLKSSSSNLGITKKINSSADKMSYKLKKPLGAHGPARRRAVRYTDEDNVDGEDSRTPIHRGITGALLREHSKEPDFVGRMHIKQDSSLENSQDGTLSNINRVTTRIGSSRMNERDSNNFGSGNLADNDSSVPSPSNIQENRSESTLDLLAGQYSIKQDGKESGSPEFRAQNIITSVKPGNADRFICNKDAIPQIKKSGTIQIQSLIKTFGNTNHSRSQSVSRKNKPSMEKSKVKSSIQVDVVTENRSDINFSAECISEKDIQMGLRSDIGREANSTDLLAASTSMRHLIAAAQAKRRLAQSHHVFNGSGTPGCVPTPRSHGRSPNLTFATYGDKKLFQAPAHTDSPSECLPMDMEEPEDYDCKPSADYEQPGNSSSSGTEAGVARDAFEGMIETLSRTRDSIGRATRLAIDCAKYGIANEVCEPL